MAFQDVRRLAADALSILNDPRPNSEQPTLVEGVHVRWSFGPDSALPLYGYYLFRRAYADRNERCLTQATAGLAPGPVAGNVFVSSFGRLTASPLVLTDDFESADTVEVSVVAEGIQVTLPKSISAQRVTAKIGFGRWEQSSWQIDLDFRRMSPGEGPNPRFERDVRVEAFRDLETPASRTVIRTDARAAGIECGRQLVLTLPRPATSIAVAVGRSRGAPCAVRALNADGSLAVDARFSPEVSSGKWNGQAITTVSIDAPGEPLLLERFTAAGPAEKVTRAVLFTVSRDGVGVDRQEIVGGPGDVVTVDLAVDGINSIDIRGDPASLIELCYWATSVRTTTAAGGPGPWTSVPAFLYPLNLPITHPGYPASPGAETLAAMRTAATQRIQYGAVADALPAPTTAPGIGTITLTPGSPLALGQGTAWDESMVGQLIYPVSVDTAFVVMTVLSADRLVLSRPFTGAQPLVTAAYRVSAEDVFAQVHDQLGALLSEPNGMRAATMPPVIEQSTGSRHVLLADGLAVAQGMGTSWTADRAGLLLEVGPRRDVYRIESVDTGFQQLTLHTPFVGASGGADYRIISRSPHNRVDEGPSFSVPPLDLLDLASISPAYAQILGLYSIDRFVEPGGSYDYIVLADHEGRFKGDSATALAWLNGTPNFDGPAVDGAVIGPIVHTGSGALPAPSTLGVLALPAGRLPATPDRPDLADSEPGLTINDLASWPSLPTAERPVMLEVWRYSHGPQMPPATPPPPPRHVRVGDRFLPSLRTPDPNAPRPPGWPDPTIVQFLDTDGGGLDVGWYSYRVNAVDLWGRFSALSGPIPWRDIAGTASLHPHAVHLEDWTPPPPPTDFMAWVLEPDGVRDPSRIADAAYKTWRAHVGPHALGLRLRWRWPWSHLLRAPDLAEFRIYAQSTPINARFHRIVSVSETAGDPTRSDVHLAAPDGLPADAYAGAMLQMDERSFAIEGSAGGAALVLRVKNGGPTQGEPPQSGVEATIVLPPEHPLHRELLDPLQWERWLTAVSQKPPTDATIFHDVDPLEDPSVVVFDAPQNPLHGTSADWNGARARLDDLNSTALLADVRPGIDVMALGSDATSLYAVLQIESVNVSQREVQILGTPPVWLTPGTYRWAIGPARQDARGAGATWNAATRSLTLAKQPDLSRVRPGIDRVYVKVNAGSTPANLQHFFDIERVDVVAHRLTLNGALSLLTNGVLYQWRIGSPVRVYELFLPSKQANDPDDPHVDKWLRASLDDPVVYATLGISAADKRTENADVRPGRTPPRPGNEGRLAAPATIFRVQRAAPDAPADGAWDSSRLWATRADYHGKSYFTVRWKKPPIAKRPHYKAVVLRTMDETLFLVDWEQPRTFPLSLVDALPSHWPAARRNGVTTELSNGLYKTLRAKTTLEDALALYRTLSDDAVSVVANLPGNDEAFAEMTLDAVDLMDPANDDRRGPDDDLATFPGVNASLNAWQDQLDGRSQNRYFYRVAFVDSAHNRGPLGKTSPAVYLPKIVPPRAPVITKILGGGLQITLHWAANREPDLAGYRVYRTDDPEKAREIRLMESVAMIGVLTEWRDSNVVELRTYVYRVTAVDGAGNESASSGPASGRAFNTSFPDPPQLDVRIVGPQTGVSTSVLCTWSCPLETSLFRRDERSRSWIRLSGWLAPGAQEFHDTVRSGLKCEYAVKVRNAVGFEALGRTVPLG